MIEHGLYVLKREYFELLESVGGDYDKSAGVKRPVYCCVKDRIHEGLYWAIPTSDLSHRSEKQKEKYNFFISLPESDLRSCYYHIATTTKAALYKVSSCLPVTDRYVDHEYESNGVHVVVKRCEIISEIERKLKRILGFESRRHNYFPQKITSIREVLIKELDENL